MKTVMTKRLTSFLCVILSALMLAGVCVCVSAAETDIAESGDSDVTFEAVMYVGDSRTFDPVNQYENITETVISGETNDVIQYTENGSSADVTALKPGTASVTIVTDSDNTGTDEPYAASHDSVRWNITVKEKTLPTPQITGFSSVDSGTKITWNAVEGAEKYRLFLKNSSGGWSKLADTANTSIIHTAPKSGSTYTYTLRCVDAAGSKFTSGYNNTGWKYTYNMATPRITSVTGTSSGVKITWGAVTNAKKYRVFYKNSSGSWSKIADTASTSLTHTAAKPGNTYTYTVRCVRSNGSVFTSGYNNTGASYSYMLATPSITALTNTTNSVKITWGAVAGAQKYRVFYKNSSGGWTGIGNTASTTLYHTGIKSGTAFTYTVRCLTSDGKTYTSNFNKTGWKHTYYAQLREPEITKFENTKNGTKLTWDAVAGAQKYRVYYKNQNGNWVKMIDTAATSYVDSTVQNGKTVTYTVRCISADSAGFTSAYSNTGWSHTYRYYNVTPALKEIMDDQENDFYAWIDDSIAEVTDYMIFVKEGSSWRSIGTVKNYKGWVYHNRHRLTAGQTYTFTVRGVDSKGYYITPYNTAGFSVTLLTPPTNLSFSILPESEKIRINWDKVAGAPRYYLKLTNENGEEMGPYYTSRNYYTVNFEGHAGSSWTVKVYAYDQNLSWSYPSAFTITR